MCKVIAALPQRGDKNVSNDALQAMPMTRESSDHFKDFLDSHIMPVCTNNGKSCSEEDTRNLAEWMPMQTQVVCVAGKDAGVRTVCIWVFE